MCREPSLSFKQRIHFAKKERTLFLDIMLDLNQMQRADDNIRRKTVIERLAEEVPLILDKYTIPDFDKARFVGDMKSWLIDIDEGDVTS